MKIEQINDCAVIYCEVSQLDASCAPEFTLAVCKKISEAPASIKAIVLNLKGVKFVDSSGLGAIILILQKVPAKVLLCCIGEQVEKLLKTTKLDSIFSWYQDVHSAVMAA